MKSPSSSRRADPVVAVEGLEHLVGLLEDERPQCLQRLHAIPRTALRATKESNGFDKPPEFFGSRCHAWVHASYANI